ncbi:diguanylate cyclase [Planosporangium thailandense]|uniref:Diguanylate cyclase n=1 Tax=Planosporangium thailandense TaxID=765197 RepID=A0ABX0XXK5_9ACTN|nr:GGDEF domain-containing protein [Planosporangium thailandense]NJC70105.1 diguanylate cyclase [Planosporangium thailandense]
MGSAVRAQTAGAEAGSLAPAGAVPGGTLDDLADVSYRTPHAVYRLVAALRAMELARSADYRAVVAPAARAERLATEWDLPDLRLRARLIRAEALLRDGDAVESGRIAEEARAWAAEHGDTYLLARSHRQLCLFFYFLGEISDALAHAVQCVAHTTDDVPARLRAKYLMSLAWASHEAGSADDGRRRHEEALELAIAIDDDELIVQILNNLAYSASEAGDHERAERLIAQLHAVAARHGSTVDTYVLDTTARIHLARGRYAEAEAVLLPVLEGSAGHPVNERDTLAECLLTVAEIRRLRGDLAAAQAALDRAVTVCTERGLGSVRARVREQQAELYATAGRYREAYAEYLRFHTEWQALQSAQQDARARTLQAVFETEEARRLSVRFREMAQRDALTGLYNRRYVDEHLAALLEAPAAGGAPLSVALVDIDHFKAINDTLSHATGDTVLQQIAALLATAVTDGGFAARLGGEEFLLVFPGTDGGDAVRRCERLRRAIAGHPWRPVTGDLPVTASIGVAANTAGDVTPSELLSRADRNLYAAKRSGRNRVNADPA